jgi:hypothetical protein
MSKILKIELSPKRYGGRIYENEIIELVKDEVEIEKVYLMKYSTKLLNIPRFIFFFLKFRYFYKGKLFLNDHTSWMAGRRAESNILIIHHIDNSYSPLHSKIFQKMNFFALNINRKLFDKTIVVSKYWKSKLVSMNFSNVSVVYNSFNPSEFVITREEKIQFKKKYFSNNKPIIYLGNALVKKGVVQSYKELKNLDVTFVTSGKSQIKIPCLNLNLSYREYLVLLSISDVVLTMSLFLEGWNRTAHEATLLGTVVVGSGKGGMKELLKKSNQFICLEFGDLKRIVKSILSKQIDIEVDKSFVSDLTKKKFKENWLKILNND